MNYRFAGRFKTLSIGVYPDVSLKEARTKRDEAKKLLAEGQDPSTVKQKAKLMQVLCSDNSFEAVAEEWLKGRKGAVSESHHRQTQRILHRDVFPFIGKAPINQITAPELLAVLRKIENRGAGEIAHKARQWAGQIFRYAIATGKAERDIASDLKGALKPKRRQHRAYLRENELPDFLGKLECYDGAPLTALALQLILLTFVRTKELRGARWDEIDVENRLWRIPKERMKMGREHLVPLSLQSLELLSAVRELTERQDLIFPNSRAPRKPMSENTMLYGMYRMGYHSQATVHGFRATASTILHERGFRSDLIERQLAHVEENTVKAAYNHAEYLSERREMMQWWADHLDTLRSASVVKA